MNTDTGFTDRLAHSFDHFDVEFDRATTAVVAMLGLDIVWWVMMYGGHVPMPGKAWLMQQGIPMTAPGAMELGVFHVGTLGAAAGYVAMWGVMMWAMMYPAMTRFVREYAKAYTGPAVGATRAVAGFLVGYHTVWALSGVIPLGVHALLPGGIYGFTHANPSLAIGGALVLAGGYQLTSFKQSRLRSCCARVVPHDTNPAGALREGLEHGVTCVAICFGLFFLVMPFFGEMNFLWMVALTGIVALERFPIWGDEIATATGIVAGLSGVAVLLFDLPLPV